MEIEQLSRAPVSSRLVAVIVIEQRPELRWGATHGLEDLALAGVVVRAAGRIGLTGFLAWAGVALTCHRFTLFSALSGAAACSSASIPD
jgi:hypothetical protein